MFLMMLWMINNFESSVVAKELELAIKRVLYGLLWSFS